MTLTTEPNKERMLADLTIRGWETAGVLIYKVTSDQVFVSIICVSGKASVWTQPAGKRTEMQTPWPWYSSDEKFAVCYRAALEWDRKHIAEQRRTHA